MRRRAVLVVLVLTAVMVAGCTSGHTRSSPSAVGDHTRASTKAHPNVLLIMTDDQALADLKWMENVRTMLAAKGTTFDGISSEPLCCPARASVLTGQFGQNNGVRSNRGPHGGYPALNHRALANSVAVWFHNAGYSTGFTGKFLNGYNRSTMPDPHPGWTDWEPLVKGVYNYHRFTIDNNGTPQRHRTYQTGFLTDNAIRMLDDFSDRKRPFFMWLSYVAPHSECRPVHELSCWSPPTPAPRDRHKFADVVPPSVHQPSFLTPPRHATTALGVLGGYDKFTRKQVVSWFRQRIRSLQAVDRGVRRVLNTLKKHHQLSNTVIMFCSDNGWVYGQHDYMGKVLPFEESLRVPMIIRGPGFPAGKVVHQVLASVDIAPTLADAAHVHPTMRVDGHSALGYLKPRYAMGWRDLLIQMGAVRRWQDKAGWYYRGIRTPRYTMVYYPNTDQYALYDRKHDPFELDNVASKAQYAGIRATLLDRLPRLGRCFGQDCNIAWRHLPNPGPPRPQSHPADAH